MLTKYFLLPAILGVAGLLIGAKSAQAQVSVSVVPVPQPTVSTAPYYYPVYYRPLFPRLYYPRYTYPSYVYYNTYAVPEYVYYSPPLIPSVVAPLPVAASTATVQVKVPDPEASVWFNETLMSAKGDVRNFTTPLLTPGVAYQYRIRASWGEASNHVTQERIVSVMAGQTTVVEFPPSGTSVSH